MDKPLTTAALVLLVYFGRLVTTTGHMKIISPSTSEVVLNASRKLSLICEGDSQIIWDYPKYQGSDRRKPSISKLGMLQSILSIDAIDFRDVGNYTCKSRNNPENFAVVYVFVIDPDHPISAEIQKFKFIGIAKDSGLIPCKPSYPTVTLKICSADSVSEDASTEIRNVKRTFTYRGLILNDFTVPNYTFLNVLQQKYLTHKLEYIILKEIISNPFEGIFLSDVGGVLHYKGDKKGFLWSQLPIRNSKKYLCCNQSCSTCKRNETFTVEVYERKYVIPKPVITIPNNTFTGENITLKCSVTVQYPNPDFELYWNGPSHLNMNTVKVWQNTTKSFSQTLKSYILNVSINDSGPYVCILKHFGDTVESSRDLQVLDDSIQKTMSFNGQVEVVQKVGESASFVVTIQSYAEPKITWYAPTGNKIEQSDKYRINTTKNHNYETKLTVYNVNIKDQGIYQLKAENNFTSNSINASLTVPDGFPFIEVSERTKLCDVRSKCYLYCTIWGNNGNVKWYFKPCSSLNIRLDTAYVPVQSRIENSMYKNNAVQSVLNLPSNQSGYVICSGSNKNGQSNISIEFVVTDIPRAKNFSIIYPKEKVYEKDDIEIQCMASKFYFEKKISLFKDNTSIGNNRKELTECETKFSYCRQLTLTNVMTSVNGEYYCKAKRRESLEEISSEVFRLTVKESRRVKILDKSNLNGKEKSIVLGSDFLLICIAEGRPSPIITWYKDKTEIMSGKNGFTLKSTNTKLSITGFNKQHEGEYACIARNRDFEDKRTIYLRISDGGPNAGYVATIIIILIILIVLLIFIVIRIRKQKKLQKILCESGLAHFAKGMPESMDPERPIDEQAEFLPYDQMWEFPPEKLKLGRQLGSGAFGVVLKAEAFGIIEDQSSTIVAVKMVKPTADAIFIKALASELKIMVHLGKHLNVVNLLGACTNKIGKGELMVIVEYCKFGNLHNYLLRNRDGFIDQIDKETGTIDLQTKLEDNDVLDSPKLEKRKYSDLISFSASGGKGEFNSNPNYLSSSSSTIQGGVVSMKQSGEISGLTSNSSNDQEWRSNYRADYKGQLRQIYTKDLIYWAYQVSRGMDYLCTRNVLHGDLAARNILLSENNVVKICDFGLAKSLYKSSNYTKKSTGPLPFKWMAIESLRDGVFSTQSDVWAFGIVLWELFSLARSPYPGLHADENLYNKLVKGYRMEKPLYATELLYEIMLDCWNSNPMRRPSFTDLTEVLGRMLDAETIKMYTKLDYPYKKMNNLLRKNKTVREDYLIKMTAPNYSNVAYPSQIENETMFMNRNTLMNSSNIDTSGYLTMSIPSIPRSSVISPTPDTSDVCSFQLSSRKSRSQYADSDGNLKNENNVEEILNDDLNRDSRSNKSTPIMKNSISNPEYHIRL